MTQLDVIRRKGEGKEVSVYVDNCVASGSDDGLWLDLAMTTEGSDGPLASSGRWTGFTIRPRVDNGG